MFPKPLPNLTKITPLQMGWEIGIWYLFLPIGVLGLTKRAIFPFFSSWLGLTSHLVWVFLLWVKSWFGRFSPRLFKGLRGHGKDVPLGQVAYVCAPFSFFGISPLFPFQGF